jgi:hypothetical protein
MLSVTARTRAMVFGSARNVSRYVRRMSDATTLIARFTRFPDLLAFAAVLMALSTLLLWAVDVDRTVVLAVAGLAALDAIMWVVFSALERRKRDAATAARGGLET